jgi:hypothetical protein
MNRTFTGARAKDAPVLVARRAEHPLDARYRHSATDNQFFTSAQEILPREPFDTVSMNTQRSKQRYQ